MLAEVETDLGLMLPLLEKGDVIVDMAGALARPRAPRGNVVTARESPWARARGRTDVPKILDWYMEGKIQIDPMITHSFSLDDINKGFDLMNEGKSIRSVVVF